MHAHYDSSYKGSQTMTLVCKEVGERARGGGEGDGPGADISLLEGGDKFGSRCSGQTNSWS
jgi:hypothetical protein